MGVGWTVLNTHKEPNPMDMNTFNKTFPHLACSDSELEKLIGLKCRVIDTRPSDGEVHREGVFQVMGVQLNWENKPSLRIKCVEFRGRPCTDNFGKCISPERLGFEN